METALQKIHDASMAILAKIGIRLIDPRVCRRLRENGVRVVGDIAFFTETQVMDWVGRAPASFTLHARNPQHDVCIGGGRPEYIAGYGCSIVIDALGRQRAAGLEDHIRFLKLVHQSERFRINGGILAQPGEIEAPQVHVVMAYAALRFSDKCLMGLPGNSRTVQHIMDLAAIAFGGRNALGRKPRLITLVNTHSPLQIDPETLNTLRLHAEYNQPLVITGGVTGGATGPVTRAGALALSNAEVLAAIAVAQMLRPGLPVVMGVVASPANMFTAGGHLGAPDYAAGVRYVKALSARYGIPCRCGGSVTDAPGLTSQSGCESMLNMFVSLQEKVDLIVHGAGILASFKGIGFEKFITDLEVIRMIEGLQEDIAVDEESMALEAIAAAGHGGQFLTLPHTLRHCRRAAWTSPIFSAKALKTGETAQEDHLARVRGELDRRLEAYRPPGMDPGLQAELEAYMTGAGVAPELLRQLDGIARRER